MPVKFVIPLGEPSALVLGSKVAVNWVVGAASAAGWSEARYLERDGGTAVGGVVVEDLDIAGFDRGRDPPGGRK